MNALCILDRELRIRARHRATAWLRVGVAAVATLTTYTWLESAAAINPAQAGPVIFGALTWLCFGFCLLEGARQTADAISGEKRDGTLGLLFLTELRGFDVVLGKLTAASVQSLYGLLGVFPVLGITLVAGGVTAGEFWRTQLALVSTLFVAAAGGLWVSARSQDPMRVLLAVGGLMVGLAVVPWALDAVVGRPGWPVASPAAGVVFAGDAAYRADPTRFWLTQALLWGLGWFLLHLAGRETQRSWREPSSETTPRLRSGPCPSGQRDWGYRIPARLHARPKRERGSPVAAPTLLTLSKESKLLIWLAVLLPALHMVVLQFLVRFIRSPGTAGGILSFLSLGAGLVSFALLAWVAARPLAEARRSGSLELLLCTPVTGEKLARGQWEALWRCLRWPMALSVLLPTGLYLLTWLSQVRGVFGSSWGFFVFLQVPALASQVVGMLATCWVAMWLGLATRSPGHAVGGTLLLVLATPWLGSVLLQVGFRLLGGTTSFSGAVPVWGWMMWGSSSLVTLGWYGWLLTRARRRLFGRFRQAAAGDLKSWR